MTQTGLQMGNQLLSMCLGPPSGLYVMDADGKHPRQLIDPFHVGGRPRDPAWSPDGKQIACVVNNNGDDIYIVDTDGQNARRVSSLGTWSRNPAWSPDGKWIAYNAYDEPIANPPGQPECGSTHFYRFCRGGRATANHTTSWATLFSRMGSRKFFLRFSDCGHPDDPLGSVETS